MHCATRAGVEIVMTSNVAAVFPLACMRVAMKVRNKPTSVINNGRRRTAAIYSTKVENVHCGQGKLHGVCTVAWDFTSYVLCYIGKDGTQRWPG